MNRTEAIIVIAAALEIERPDAGNLIDEYVANTAEIHGVDDHENVTAIRVKNIIEDRREFIAEGKASVEVKAETVHVTLVRSDGGVFGHDTRCCNDAGCAGLAYYYPALAPASVVEGGSYEYDPATGKILAEIL